MTLLTPANYHLLPQRLSPEERAKIEQRQRYCTLHLTGEIPLRKAIKMAKSNDPYATARRIVRNFQRYGWEALIDRRKLPTPKPETLSAPVQKVITAWWYARPAAGYGVLHRKIVESCTDAKLPVPSRYQVKRFLQSRPEAEKLIRAGDTRKWEREAYSVMRLEEASFANERWEIDTTLLPIWVRLPDGSLVKPYLLAIIDTFSRVILAYLLIAQAANSWHAARVLHKAIRRKDNPSQPQGIPCRLRPDRGGEFKALAFLLSLVALGIEYDPADPYSPNQKGHIERFFLTLDENFLVGEEGHTDVIGTTEGAALKHKEFLLSFDELDAKLGQWIQEIYHQRMHSETKRKPLELWLETVQLRLPQSERELDLLLMKADKTRKVRNTGIDFTYQGQSGRYWDKRLASWHGVTVTVRFNPDKLSSILLYSPTTGEFLCEAFRQGDENFPYQAEDFKAARQQEAARLRSQRQQGIDAVRARQKRPAAPTPTSTKQATLLEAPSAEADRLYEQMLAETQERNP